MNRGGVRGEGSCLLHQKTKMLLRCLEINLYAPAHSVELSQLADAKLPISRYQ